MSGPVIDLRSDTVTRPDDGMRRAMATAEVGDDVFGEDPTVNRLEAEAASLAGLEAGLFVPSGTMGNEIALNVHASPGSEVVCDSIARREVSRVLAAPSLTARPHLGLLDQPAARKTARGVAFRCLRKVSLLQRERGRPSAS